MCKRASMFQLLTAVLAGLLDADSAEVDGEVEYWQTAKNTPDERLKRMPALPLQTLPSFTSPTTDDYPSADYPERVVVLVDSHITYQEIVGFGGAFTQSSAHVWQSLSPELRDEVITAYFDDEDGLGYTTGRVPINSCDFSPETYSFDEADTDYDLVHFDNTVAVDAARTLPMILAAEAVLRERSVVTSMQVTSQLSCIQFRAGTAEVAPRLKLVASPWSPPAWMKTNSNMLNGGRVNDTSREAWARYIVKWMDAYASYGIKMWAVTVQNEPESAQQWESCEYDPDEEASFVVEFLGPILRAAYPDLKILGFDHNKDHLLKWALTLFDESSLSSYYFDGIAFHWYAGNCHAEVALVANSFPSKILLPTEACYELSQASPGDFDGRSFLVNGVWARGEGYGNDILLDLEAGAAGWTDWNLILDERGGPNHVHNFCDAPVLADTQVAGGELHYHPQYYYLGHFSKFLTPGSRRVHLEAAPGFHVNNEDEAGYMTHSDASLSQQAHEQSRGTDHKQMMTVTDYISMDGIKRDCEGWPAYGLCPARSLKITAFRRPDDKIAVVVMNCDDYPKSLNVEIDRAWFFHNPSVPAHSIQTYVVCLPVNGSLAVDNSFVLFQRAQKSKNMMQVGDARNLGHLLLLLMLAAGLASLVTVSSQRVHHRRSAPCDHENALYDQDFHLTV